MQRFVEAWESYFLPAESSSFEKKLLDFAPASPKLSSSRLPAFPEAVVRMPSPEPAAMTTTAGHIYACLSLFIIFAIPILSSF